MNGSEMTGGVGLGGGAGGATITPGAATASGATTWGAAGGSDAGVIIGSSSRGSEASTAEIGLMTAALSVLAAISRARIRL
jgi:hypothetical protein